MWQIKTKPIKIIVLCALFLVVFFCLTNYLFYRMEVKEYYFRSSTVTVELIDKGWIPRHIYNFNAYNINVKYNLDTNEVWIKSEFSVESLNLFVNLMAQNGNSVPLDNAIFPLTRPGEWWPMQLVGNYKQSTNSLHFEYYKEVIDHTVWHYAIIKDASIIYMWVIK